MAIALKSYGTLAELPNRWDHTRQKYSWYHRLGKYTGAIDRHVVSSEILSFKDQYHRRHSSIHKMPTIEAFSVSPSSEFAQSCDVVTSVGGRSHGQRIVIAIVMIVFRCGKIDLLRVSVGTA